MPFPDFHSENNSPNFKFSTKTIPVRGNIFISANRICGVKLWWRFLELPASVIKMMLFAFLVRNFKISEKLADFHQISWIILMFSFISNILQTIREKRQNCH